MNLALASDKVYIYIYSNYMMSKLNIQDCADF